MLGIGHHHVGRQAMREGADLARRAAGRRLAGQGERAVAGRRDLPGQEMEVVDELVGPDAAHMLVEPHRPERHDLAVRVGVELGQVLEHAGLDARELGHGIARIFRDQLAIGLEVRRVHDAGIGGVRGLLLERVLGPQAVADIRHALEEGRVPVDEVLVDPPGLDDVVGDVVEDREVGPRPEDDRQVGQIRAAVLVGGQHGDPHVRMAEAAVGQAGPQHRVHLRHVRAPEHERVGRLEIVVAAHRLVDAEGPDEGGRGRGHAVARVGVEIVGAEARAHQLGRGVALPDRPLAGAEHADRRRPLLAQHTLGLRGHHVERLLPGDRRELAVLGVLAAPHAQQRRGQAVGAVHDLGQEVALDAVEAAVDLGLGVAMGRHDLACLDADHDAAAGAAEAAGRLGPLDLEVLDPARHRLGGGGKRDVGGERCERCRLGLDGVAPGQLHTGSPRASGVVTS